MPFFFNGINSQQNQNNRSNNFNFFNSNQGNVNRQSQHSINRPNPFFGMFNNNKKVNDVDNGYVNPVNPYNHQLGPIVMQPNQQNDMAQNNGQGMINFQPITPEQMEKIQAEIDINKEKVASGNIFSDDKTDKTIHKEERIFDRNKDNTNRLNDENLNNKGIEYLKEFIQSGSNSRAFYKSLSKIVDNINERDKILKIADDCLEEEKFYNKIYSDINSHKFNIEDKNIDFNIGYTDGLIWAIEEELSEYDRLCKFIEDKEAMDSFNSINDFYSRALKKLKRIGTLQYLLIRNKG